VTLAVDTGRNLAVRRQSQRYPSDLTICLGSFRTL
jgi:hypothetical protein